MSRFLSRSGSTIDNLQRQLARRQTSEQHHHQHNNDPFSQSSLSSSHVGYGTTSSAHSSHFLHRRQSSAGSNTATPLLETLDQLAAPFSKPSSRHFTSKSLSFVDHSQSPSATEEPLAPPAKLDTFEGVFIPTILSIWGIILFLRFGLIIGGAGIIGTLAMLCVGYIINILTTFSLSAISTNGTVRGGGPYYMISRSLGPEFGGSIGLVFYLGTVLSCSMNIVGFVEPLFKNFGKPDGELLPILPQSWWWGIWYGTALLVVCTIVCLAGSKPYARMSLILAVLLLISTISIFISFLFKKPFTTEDPDVTYTGFMMSTFLDNLWPCFMRQKGLPGCKNDNLEGFRNVFGLLFPACNGILAGASMSGDLRNPSQAIPRGTLDAVYVSFVSYFAIIILMGGSILRATMQTDLNVVQDVALVPFLVTLGSLSAAIYAVLGNIISAAKILQAIARDNLISFLSPFGQGTPQNDDPTYAILLTFLLSQLFVFLPSIDTIAALVTMTYLLTFLTTNLACFILKIGSAPNFRPSFHYFKWWTAALGVFVCFFAMVFVDGWIALVAMGFMALVFGWIHYASPPKSWGDVSQNLIYHQVRKYLLRLDSRKEHVKFWRPQVLLLVNNPRTAYQSIVFCNALKKGALYVLGHVIEGNFRDNLGELKRQQGTWLRFVDHARIKAFVHVTIADTVRRGARNIVLGSGLGGMRPNIVVLGWFDLDGYRAERGLPGSDSAKSNAAKADYLGPLPTDTARVEPPVPITDYVGVVEDVLLLGKAVAIGIGFRRLGLSPTSPPPSHEQPRQFIDLWPIQMTAPVDVEGGGGEGVPGLVATNFDTYTMVLQMGTILHMVPYWKERYSLRVICFVEHEDDVEEERRRVGQLLENLRVPAVLVVLWLDGGDVGSYETIVRGRRGVDLRTERVMAAWAENDRRAAEAKPVFFPPDFPERSSSASDLERDDTMADLRGRGTAATVVGSPRTNFVRMRSPNLFQRRPSFRRQQADSLPASLGMKISVPLPTDPDDISESSSEEDDELADQETTEFFMGQHPSNPNATAPVLVPISNPIHRLPPNASAVQSSSLPSKASSHFRGNSLTGGELTSSPPQSPTFARSVSSDAAATNALDFNTLSSRAQHFILNDLMRLHSTKNTAIIFTTLPAPEPHTSDDEAASLAYLEELNLLVEGLPPTLMIHAKSLTVTMAL